MRESYTQMGHLWNKINLVTSPKKKHILHSYWHLRFFAKSTELGNKIKFDNFLKCIHLNRHVVMGFFSFFLGYLMISIFWQKHSHKFSQFCTNTKSQTNCQKKKNPQLIFCANTFCPGEKNHCTEYSSVASCHPLIGLSQKVYSQIPKRVSSCHTGFIWAKFFLKVAKIYSLYMCVCFFFGFLVTKFREN